MKDRDILITMKSTDTGRWAEGWPWRTFFGIWLIYLLTAQGRIGLEDASSMLNVSRSVLSGSIHVPEGYLTVVGVDGRFYCHYGPLTSVLWLPFVIVGRGLHALGAPPTEEQCEELVVSFVSGLIAVICLGYLCWLWRERGVSSGRVRAGLWLWGMTTCLWPYSRLPGSDLLMGLAVLAAVVHFELRREQARHLWLTGLWLGLAVLARKQAQTIVPILGMWMFWRCWEESRDQKTAPVGLSRLWWIVTGTVMPFLVQLTYNQLRYGSPFIEKYAGVVLQAPTLGLWFERIGRLLFGWEHGFLVYNGVTVLVVCLAIPSLSGSTRRLLALLGVLLTSQIAFLATLQFWEGGVCFGSRFLVFLALLAALFWPEVSFSGSSRRKWLLGLVAGLSVAVQLLGVLVDPLTGFRRAELEPGRAHNQTIGLALESLRVLHIPAGRLSSEAANDAVMRHPPFQVPDFWWCQIRLFRLICG